ncbi:MAG: DNA polymerase IV [Desulfarculaceae bacterium]|nr:DNA polymerase IV [Desulfarculaceae bacterium]MCF8072712.1 DNA polymerase IV [Desulfarculaceae bacterium]MCF8102591.1 DNA polymerase IV [Desulfarculaceae bacterium]MCF8116500.1 DNA polymerase IV [Desulfarculaceae bacterium]
MLAQAGRLVAHVDMDAFYAAVERLDDPGLTGRPIIVGGGRRGVVSAASYEARRYGVRSAMPMFQARARCPQGAFLPVRMERYVQVSRQVMLVLAGFSPLLEQVSVDEAYLDLSGTERLWGDPAQTGRAIKQAVRGTIGLTCSVGLAPVRFLAKIASDRDKPDGLTVVSDLEAFLATVSLAEVPGVGAKARERLGAMGLNRLIEARALGAERLERTLGVLGRRLWELAWGRDDTPVTPEREVKSISNERTLERDTADRELLGAHLLGLSQKVARRLRRQGLSGRTVTLKLKHADHRLVTRSETLAGPTEAAEEVYAAAHRLLGAYSPPGPFRLIGVGISGLGDPAQGQAGLFTARQKGRQNALDRAEDAIVARFGDQALTRAGSLTTLDQKPFKRHNKDEAE